MTTLSHIVDVLIHRASQDRPIGTSDSTVLGLGTRHDQVAHTDPAHIDTSAVNRVIDSALGALAGDHLHEVSFTQPQHQAIFLLRLIPLVLNWIRQHGGLLAALAVLEQNGLAVQVQSWIGSGVNERIMPEMLNGLFSQEQLERVAQQCSVQVDTVRTGLATVLPQVIDTLTTSHESESLSSVDIEINNILNRLTNI
ncbi:YidB family protein [Alkanindiges sp. WGS2144]|uniref:YidB family protein n=1 Tax=Alkanindiges sp. WGS2144 TaxID=3366808 RepID=UPI00374FDEAD